MSEKFVFTKYEIYFDLRNLLFILRLISLALIKLIYNNTVQLKLMHARVSGISIWHASIAYTVIIHTAYLNAKFF